LRAVKYRIKKEAVFVGAVKPGTGQGIKKDAPTRKRSAEASHSRTVMPLGRDVILCIIRSYMRGGIRVMRSLSGRNTKASIRDFSTTHTLFLQTQKQPQNSGFLTSGNPPGSQFQDKLSIYKDKDGVKHSYPRFSPV
jgi:hypothetical protein